MEQIGINNKNVPVRKSEYEDFPALMNIIEKNKRSAFTFKDFETEHREERFLSDGLTKISAYEKTLSSYLKRQGVSTPVKKISASLFEISLDEDDIMYDDLPKGYVYHGGAARAILARKLGIEVSPEARDIDFCYAGSIKGRVHDDYLMAKYSPDDFSRGHGVSDVSDAYFSTRDFTINELLVADKKLILSKDCLLDTVRGIVRITEYEKKESYDEDLPYYINPKILAKALRLAADKALLLADEEEYACRQIDAFHIALHLNRAINQGREVTQEYIRLLKENKQIPEDLDGLEQLLRYLHENTDFLFRIDQKKRLEAEPEILAEILGENPDNFDSLPYRQSMSRRK